MSGWPDPLYSGQTGAPVGCGGTQGEEEACVGELERPTGPELWTRELGLQEGSQDPSENGLAPVTSDLFPFCPPALAKGLHQQRRLGHSTCPRRQTETPTTGEKHAFAETIRDMQTHVDPDVHAQAVLQAHLDNCGQMEINPPTGSVGPERSRTISPEAVHTTSPQPANDLASTNQRVAPVLTAETDSPSTFCPVPIGPNPNTGCSPPPVEAEKKYALRSSGRPRFPCHLRKSSRLRRSLEDGEKRAGRDRGVEEEDDILEERIWRVKEEEVAVGEKEEHSSVEAVLPVATCPTEIALALTVPKPTPKAMPKPGPRLGHKPGPKSRSRPAPKAVHKAAPKSVKQRQAARSMAHCATPQLPFANTTTITAPLTSKQEPVAEGSSPSKNRRRGRFVGVS